MSKGRMAAVSVLLVFFLLSFITLYFEYFLLLPPGTTTDEIVFTVKKGSSLKAIVDCLKARNLVRSRNLFIFYAILKGGEKNIKAGEYSLNQSMTPIKILNILVSGVVNTYPITIPEGLTAEQTADIFASNNFVDKDPFLSLVRNKNTVASFHIEGPSLEGYLFPDTYFLSKNMKPEDLIALMVKRFWNVLDDLLKNRESPMSVKEIVTLGSIVEKETGLHSERQIIASVFLNRLKRNMRLSSDPTVIYGLKYFDGNLRKKDLETHSPYNTYLNYGLPPGPIANPGKASLAAVINPAKTDYLYFVSKNDGSHYFSETLSEHNRAVARYQKKQGHNSKLTP